MYTTDRLRRPTASREGHPASDRIRPPRKAETSQARPQASTTCCSVPVTSYLVPKRPSQRRWLRCWLRRRGPPCSSSSHRWSLPVHISGSPSVVPTSYCRGACHPAGHGVVHSQIVIISLPESTSRPRPPSSRTLPGPPNSRSAPAPPSSMSSLSPPNSASLPSAPISTSSPGVPRSTSLRPLPTRLPVVDVRLRRRRYWPAHTAGGPLERGTTGVQLHGLSHTPARSSSRLNTVVARTACGRWIPVPSTTRDRVAGRAHPAPTLMYAPQPRR